MKNPIRKIIDKVRDCKGCAERRKVVTEAWKKLRPARWMKERD